MYCWGEREIEREKEGEIDGERVQNETEFFEKKTYNLFS